MPEILAVLLFGVLILAGPIRARMNPVVLAGECADAAITGIVWTRGRFERQIGAWGARLFAGPGVRGGSLVATTDKPAAA